MNQTIIDGGMIGAIVGRFTAWELSLRALRDAPDSGPVFARAATAADAHRDALVAAVNRYIDARVESLFKERLVKSDEAARKMHEAYREAFGEEPDAAASMAIIASCRRVADGDSFRWVQDGAFRKCEFSKVE